MPISGAVVGEHQVKLIQVTVINSSLAFTFLPLVFLSPTSEKQNLQKNICLFRLPFSFACFLFACVLVCLLKSSWPKTPNFVTSRILIIMILLVLRLLPPLVRNHMKSTLPCWILLWKSNFLAFLVKMPHPILILSLNFAICKRRKMWIMMLFNWSFFRSLRETVQKHGFLLCLKIVLILGISAKMLTYPSTLHRLRLSLSVTISWI